MRTTEDQSMQIDRLIPLVHYFKALVKSYPDLITQKELAVKANVTKSAVNKIKDRLFDLCDKNALAYRSKLVLSSDIRTFLKLIVLLIFTEGGYSVRELLESNYGREMLHRTYESLRTSEDLNRFEELFDEEEFQRAIEIISPNLDCLGPLDLLVSKLDDLDEELLIQTVFSNILQRLVNEFKFWIRDEVDILFLHNQKARFCTLLKEHLKKRIEKLEIITNLRSDEKREIYMDVYSQTIDCYLPKIFDLYIGKIKQERIPHVEIMD